MPKYFLKVPREPLTLIDMGYVPVHIGVSMSSPMHCKLIQTKHIPKGYMANNLPCIMCRSKLSVGAC